MKKEKIRVLGIHSSPVRNGNTESLLRYALEEAEKEGAVETELLSLRGLEIKDCVHCNWCMKKQTAEKLCAISDDALPVLGKIRDCDVLVLASPVYFGRLSGTMACLIDRTRCFIFGRENPMALRGKAGVALTVGWLRNGGIETTLESLHLAFLVHEMWTPSVHRTGSFFGAGAVSGGRFDPENPLMALRDGDALQGAAALIRKAVRMAFDGPALSPEKNGKGTAGRN